MTRILSIEEIRRWCCANFTRGNQIEKTWANRELPMGAFCRTVGIPASSLTRIKQGKDAIIGPRAQRLISRFIADWENGLLEFGGTRERGRVLIHRAVPKPRPPRMTLALTARGPRIAFLARPSMNERIFLTAKAK